MAERTANKLVPIIVGAVFVFIVALFFKSNNTDEVSMADAPDIVAPDGDSTADTLRTLTAEIKAVRQENEALRQKQIEVENRLNETPADDENISLLNDLSARVDSLAETANSFGSEPDPEDGDYSYDLEQNVPQPVDVWIEPLDDSAQLSSALPASFDTPSLSSPLDSLDTSALDGSAGQLLTAGATGGEKPILDPVYTIPRNATLIGSTGMTAMIGRIPVDGSIEDPYPVKIIVGRDNLAANGLEIPEVSYMVFSGTASGDWTLSCVRADLTSATFVFDDGTIRTVSVGDESLESNSNTNTTRIAWISDQRGIPCVSGKRISNASTQLTQAILAGTVAAGAKAVSNAEKTNVVSAQGDTTSSVTGNAIKSAGFDALAGGSTAVLAWLKRRQKQSFDVIYVDTGAEVAIHVDAELQIDYNPNGRKLNHGFNTQAHVNRYLD